jgi:hypothetical protein
LRDVTADEDEDAVTLHPGMVITVRTRHDVVIVDPDRFLAAARHAYPADNPGTIDDDLEGALQDPYYAVDALMDRYYILGSDHPEVAAGSSKPATMHGGLGLRPGRRIPDRPDGLSPAGTITHIEFGTTPRCRTTAASCRSSTRSWPNHPALTPTTTPNETPRKRRTCTPCNAAADHKPAGCPRAVQATGSSVPAADPRGGTAFIGPAGLIPGR